MLIRDHANRQPPHTHFRPPLLQRFRLTPTISGSTDSGGAFHRQTSSQHPGNKSHPMPPSRLLAVSHPQRTVKVASLLPPSYPPTNQRNPRLSTAKSKCS